MPDAISAVVVFAAVLAVVLAVRAIAWRACGAARPLWRSLQSAQGQVGWLKPGLLTVAIFAIAALLSGLTEEVVKAGAVLRFDQALNAALTPWRTPPAIAAALWITDLGSGPCLVAVATVASLMLWLSGRLWLVPTLWTVFAAAQATTWAGKLAVARHRPEFIVGAMQAASFSFPSGHATGAACVYGFLAFVLTRERSDSRSRFEIWFWACALILLVGASRVFLSVHYTTDVAGGYLVGAFWVLVGVLTTRRRPARAG